MGTAFALVSLSNLLGIAASFPTWAECTKPGMVHTGLSSCAEELVPAACHITEQYANNLIEADHGRLKARLRPMRGLTQLRSPRVISAGRTFVQNLRRGHYQLGVDEAPQHRLPAAFAELALAHLIAEPHGPAKLTSVT